MALPSSVTVVSVGGMGLPQTVHLIGAFDSSMARSSNAKSEFGNVICITETHAISIAAVAQFEIHGGSA